ncbi:MAG: hypothetical protein ACT4QD_08940 [Acidobacteriota bacterium]
MSEADLEYGPTPEEAEHEHTDIEPMIAGKFAVWLTVAVLLSAGSVYGAFWLFEGREQEASRAAQVFPLSAGQVREPQAPRLQTQPFKDVYLLHEAEREKLTTYGWVDQANGVVRIPIDEAMQIVTRTGRVPSAHTPAGLDQVAQDSSSGRTAAGRR